MSDFLILDPAELSKPDAYKLLLNCVAPRPIAFTSTLSPEGIPNLAPFSFFMAGGANPPSVVISPTHDRLGEPKDTYRNIELTGEYVINVVTFEMREKMNICSSEYPYGISEWEKSGFTPSRSRKVRPAAVLESPLSMECKLFQIVPHGSGHMSANYIIGEVVCFHIAKYLLDGDEIDPRRVDYISRMSGDWYSRSEEEAMFALPRPERVKKCPGE